MGLYQNSFVGSLLNWLYNNIISSAEEVIMILLGVLYILVAVYSGYMIIKSNTVTTGDAIDILLLVLGLSNGLVLSCVSHALGACVTWIAAASDMLRQCWRRQRV